MKKLALLMICMIAIVGYSQSNDCGELPRAKVDEKAELKTNIEKLMNADMPSTLKEDGDHTAVFKAYVDCHGDVAKHRLQNSDMSEADQQWLWKIIGKSTWKPAVFEKKDVTSTVFITVTVTNGQIEIINQ
ncbi:MAG: hypothetical protein BM555_05455 [Crocinitomix sp. MedPE-SWsnd]|nr:MAG: hypothetical protein BM555_05455 [Crocinitomix sp. MedPE-SWsnd]